MQALQSQLDFKEQSTVDKSQVGRQEAKVRELETKLEFEKTQVKRLEVRALCWRWEAVCTLCSNAISYTNRIRRILFLLNSTLSLT